MYIHKVLYIIHYTVVGQIYRSRADSIAIAERYHRSMLVEVSFFFHVRKGKELEHYYPIPESYPPICTVGRYIRYVFCTYVREIPYTPAPSFLFVSFLLFFGFLSTRINIKYIILLFYTGIEGRIIIVSARLPTYMYINACLYLIVHKCTYAFMHSCTYRYASSKP